jgi:hypothetical protein
MKPSLKARFVETMAVAFCACGMLARTILQALNVMPAASPPIHRFRFHHLLL